MQQLTRHLQNDIRGRYQKNLEKAGGVISWGNALESRHYNFIIFFIGM